MLDTNHGKRSCFLDLAAADDAGRLRELVRSADVFSQALVTRMLQSSAGPEDWVKLRPGLIYTSIGAAMAPTVPSAIAAGGSRWRRR